MLTMQSFGLPATQGFLESEANLLKLSRLRIAVCTSALVLET